MTDNKVIIQTHSNTFTTVTIEEAEALLAQLPALIEAAKIPPRPVLPEAEVYAAINSRGETTYFAPLSNSPGRYAGGDKSNPQAAIDFANGIKGNGQLDLSYWVDIYGPTIVPMKRVTSWATQEYLENPVDSHAPSD